MMPVAMIREGPLEHTTLIHLYVWHAPEDIRLAFLLTGDRALAEDLVQVAFARLVGRPASGDRRRWIGCRGASRRPHVRELRGSC